MTSTLARWCIALAVHIGRTSASLAATVNCSIGGDLQAAINVLPSGQTLSITGPCTGGPFTIAMSEVTLAAVGGGATIHGQVYINALLVTLSGLTIDGTGAAAGSGGVNLGSAPNGDNLTAVGSSAVLVNCTIQTWPGDGIDIQGPTFLQIVGGSIKNNGGIGISGDIGANVQLADVGGGILYASPQSVEVTNNQGGGISVTNGTNLELYPPYIHDNPGFAIRAANSSIGIGTEQKPDTGTISAGATGVPMIQLFNSTFQSDRVTFLAPSNSNAVVANGSKLLMSTTTITSADGSDATLLVQDGSSVTLLGGNTISNTGSNGIAIEVSNGSTVHQQSLSRYGGPAAADMITGFGVVQVQSNMELGTGSGPPSATSWTGAITVQQNSSFRLDGGISISGGVSLIQGSNGFFNKSAGGTNATAVACSGTDSSHVAGAAAVSPPVTLVTVGVGCYAF